MSLRSRIVEPVRRAFAGHGPHFRLFAPAINPNKVCCIEDFAHPDLRTMIRVMYPHDVARFGPLYPAGHEFRKPWETAMAATAMERAGVLHQGAEVLGVGAGHEPTSFWLTTRVGRVFATDLYLDPMNRVEFADGSMLTEPGRHWPSVWNPRRLVAQHMSALDLQYEDGAFDAVFSSSSVEHFRSVEEVRRALREIHRVLKPGGVLSISTAYRLEGPGPGTPGTLPFDETELRQVFFGELPWQPLSEFDPRVTRATLDSAPPLEEAAAHGHTHHAKHGRGLRDELEYQRHPQLVHRRGELLFTSVHLALRKPAH